MPSHAAGAGPIMRDLYRAYPATCKPYSTVLVAALFNFYNRLADGVGLALPEGYPAEAGKRLSTQGYDVFAQGSWTPDLGPLAKV